MLTSRSERLLTVEAPRFGSRAGTSGVGAIAPSPDTLFEPVDGDPGLRSKWSASPETTMTAEKRIPSRHRDPWNKGRMTGQKRPLKPKDVWTIRVRLQLEGRKRDLAMFNLAIDSKLRGCDLVRLRIGRRESSRSSDRDPEEDWAAGSI